MTPLQLQNFLNHLVARELKLSTMIWGAPGIGKSSIVAQVAARHELEWIDVRLSQLAPTDLRGLPVARDGMARWFAPEFLPREGRGILFLDELNMAPPAMQGIAQQLILDRRVGSYSVPSDWFIWAAGNRREDRASVFEMPAPLANRFLHLQVEPDFDSFKSYALAHEFDERILAFLSFRTALLHKMDMHAPAWPSPRSWEMANHLLGAELPIESAVGEGAAAEFTSYIQLYQALPDLQPILEGQGNDILFPDEPSIRYALITGLTVRSQNVTQAHRAFRWLIQCADPEWVQLFAGDLVRLLRGRKQLGALAELVAKDEKLREFVHDYQNLVAG